MSGHPHFEYYYGDESEQFSYFRIPRLLMTGEQFKGLSTDAKLLYGLFLDRMGLSARNGWYDDQGRVYLYYTADEIREDMGCGNDKALKLLAELDTRKGVGLIERVKQGQGKPTKIYVKKFTTQQVPPCPSEPAPAGGPDIGKPDFKTSDFPTSRPRKIRGQDIGKTDSSYIEINKTDSSYPDPSIHPAPPARMDRYDLREAVKAQIDYAVLRETHPCDDLDCLLELITDVLLSTTPAIRIGRVTLPAEVVKERFKRLDSTHIEYVLDALKTTTTEIHNIRAYLLTALYHAPVTMGPYYAAAVRHDYG